ncbi:Tetratricopeptide repeat protein [Enhygromyxa salina]|uniref:Tetratricopeptide repeat protein n=1 Tax=Enhygromyxa salina TaxID=215803 RepID=A0A2S9XET1_9BACT|nr:tetratricopeptide repeat protein [Enhygromyxa salina]PRP91374.1 Tetratricopeptide repeat protein [Enhygromyxa salina]
MTSDDPPATEPDERPEHTDGGGSNAGAGPGVGNVLGFSLLFRERRALLALNRRSLAPGVRLREYEAVLPGVRFPLRGPLTATKFRKHRARLVGATLTVEDRALRPWLRERLIGQELLGVRVDEVELELRRELPEAELPRPCLMLGGETSEGGQAWLLVAFDIEPVHRLLVLRPCRLWLVGQLPERLHDGRSFSRQAPYSGEDASIDREGRDASARRLWRAIARRLAAGVHGGVRTGVGVGEGGALTIDAARVAMTRPFASVGWKAPNLEGCAIESLALSRRGVTIELRGPLTEAEAGEEGELGEGASTPSAEPPASEAAAQAVAPVDGEPGLLDEAIGRGLDQARDLLRASRVKGGEIGPALERLAALSRELHEFPAAHLALVRWRVALSRFLDRDLCLAAVREWLDLQPSAAEPRRLVTSLLAAEGRAQDLARLLAAECRQPHPPLAQARLELAVASLLIDHLDDPRSALALVGPLSQRLREQVLSLDPGPERSEAVGAPARDFSARTTELGRDRRAEPRRGGPSRGAAFEGAETLAGLEAILPEALVVLARARVAEVAREGRSLATVPHVIEALDEALAATPNPRRRADLRARVAESFARYGAEHGDDRRGDIQALALLEAAIVDDPEDLHLVDRAIELALRTDARATAAELLRVRLAAAAADERASLRKRLIAVAAELDDREHLELARRELALALEHEPDNAVLLRRAAVLERKLGDARAAAEFLARLLELDDQGEVTLDDRDLLVLDRARLLRRAGQIDDAWDSLRPALARIPELAEAVADDDLAQRWVLDVLELALDLSPPTDRPRILDLLITHARGQRRGEALVERAAQALRVDERLADLWAAIDELDQPQKVLAQIEQLLDDRDYEGLARLAEVATRERERATELHARARLGCSLLDQGDPDNAAGQLERALELAPERLDLRRALASAYEGSGRIDAAVPLLDDVLRGDREAPPDERARLTLRLTALLRELDQPQAASELLTECERELSRVEPERVTEELREAIAEQSFAVLRELGEDERALSVALDQAAALWSEASDPATAERAAAERLGAWLARAARVLDEAGVEELGELSQQLAEATSDTTPRPLPRTRVSLLEAAVELRPDDRELAEGLEQVLRELGDHLALELHLRRQIDRNVDPDVRAGLLERLIASLETHRVPGHERELAELLGDLLVLRPQHTAAMLTLGRLRAEAGELAEARQLWAVVGERLAPDDRRFYGPALELARDALDTGEPDQAKALAMRARALEPALPEPLTLLSAIADELDDPALAAEALAARLTLDDDADDDARLADLERAELELERASALAKLFERDANAEAAAAAIAHYAAAERLVPGRERQQDRSSAARRWLALAVALDDLDQQAQARAVLRETIGDDLEIEELRAEIELLDRQLDRPLAALERLEWALSRRDADPQLLAAFGRLLAEREDELELGQRGQRILRSLIKELEPGPARTRAAEQLVELGERLDDPTSVAFALDQLDAVRVERGELAALREWAIRKLGRVQEEIGSVESRLASGGLPPERRAALVERLLALHDGELQRTAARLLELAEQAEREVAAALADAAVGLLEPPLRDDEARGERELLELGISALRSLARHANPERVVERWPLVELAVLEGVDAGAGLRPLANLVELATTTNHPTLGERADTLLAEQLPDHPDDPRLMRGVWARSSGEVLLREGEQGRATIVALAAAWLEDLVARQGLDAEVGATMLDALASLVVTELDVDAAAAMLRERALAHIDERERFFALMAKLEARRRWPELLVLLSKAAELERPPGADPEAWLALADAAAVDADLRSEVRARERAGELLGHAAGLFSDRQGSSRSQAPLASPPAEVAGDGLLTAPPTSRADIDEPLARRALAELRRALELEPEPDHGLLRWRLGLALARLGDNREAFDCLVVLWEREQWSAAGVELGELALRCGELASELGEHERAVELLTVAHTRAGDDWREYATEALFAAQLESGEHEAAVALASARASELQDRQSSVRWLRRAAKLAVGPRKVELLTRARELAPEDEALMDELEAELRALGHHDALESLLRERIARYMAIADDDDDAGAGEGGDLSPALREAWTGAIEALIGLLQANLGGQLGLGEGPEQGLGETVEDSERSMIRVDPRRVAEVIALSEELLALEPDHVEALMTVAAEHHRRGRSAEALALWTRAEPQLADDDPRLFEVALHLADHRASTGEHGRAYALLERALALQPDDLATLERRHELACALDDPARVLHAATALLERGASGRHRDRVQDPGASPDTPAALGASAVKDSQDLARHRQAELEGDVARAQALLDAPAAAIEAIERAVSLVDERSELHRELVQRWLTLLAESEFDDDDPLAAQRRELAARTELRRALGAELDRDLALRELDLLIGLGEWDGAAELLERLLIAEPTAADLRARLRELDPSAASVSDDPEPRAPEAIGERGLRSLRHVVDTLGPGPARDQLARELALAGRNAGAARTTLDALDRLSGQAAAAPELLDLRVWALRKLDRIEDELGELDALLAAAGHDPEADQVVLDRLRRALEHDAAGCATRLIELAGEEPREAGPTPPTRVWLLGAALELIHEHAPERVALGVRALSPLLELVSDPQLLVELDPDEESARRRIGAVRRSWQQLAAAALAHAGRDRRALELIIELIAVADRAAASALPGFSELGEMLLDRATVDFPDHGPLHALSRERSGGDPGAALERVERLADTHHMDPRGRARLYLGLAATLSDDPGDLGSGDSGVYLTTGVGQSPRTPRRKFLRDLAGYHAVESAIYAPLREALRKLGAFTELLALLAAVDADADQWLELAEDAGAGQDFAAEAAARRQAGLALFERVLAEEREGGGLAASAFERACVQLGAALELEPDDPATQYHYGRALERSGDNQAAFAQLVPLVQGDLHRRARVELGPLARRCGLLALDIGEREQAAELLRLAYDSLTKLRTRVAVAEHLFELLSALDEDSDATTKWSAQASTLAREVAELIEAERASASASDDPARAAKLAPLPWLERAARLADDETERARLYARAHELDPDDGRLADLYESSLRTLERDDELEQLLRQRIATGLRSGDRARTVAQLERLLALLDAPELDDATLPLATPPEPSADAREAIRDRAELLEQLLRLAPDRLEARLELASLRIVEGDREAAAVHWRALAGRLPVDDRRFLAPARALARHAIDTGELDQARAWLERSLTIEPGDRQSLEQLLEVGRGLDLPELVLSTSATLLAGLGSASDANGAAPGPSPEAADPATARSRAALLRERARAYERLDRRDAALAEIRAAAAVSEPGSEDHIETARQWLRLATRDASRVLLREDEVKLQAEIEAEARAQLRLALGERLPARAYSAEAELLADRLERRGPAIDLLLTGLRHHPEDADLLAAFEELCAIAGEQPRFVRSLAELLAGVAPDDELTRVRLGEKLARAARAIDDPRACLGALESLPGEVSERPELLELRDWAVRGLGGVEDELARLDQRVLALAPGSAPERLQALVTRMLRLLGDAGEPCATRLLALAERDDTEPELARSLARTALRVAREYAPERLGVALAALRATLERDAVKAVAAWWPGVETLALDARELAAIIELLQIAISAERDGGVAYGNRADRLSAAAARIAPGDPDLHAQLLRRAKLAALGLVAEPRDASDSSDAEPSTRPDPALDPRTPEQVDAILDRLFTSLDALARDLDLAGAALAELWSSAMTLVEVELVGAHAPDLPARVASALRERVEAQVDAPETYAALLSLLRERACWADVVDLLLWADERHHDLELDTLAELADEAGAAGDEVTRRRARIELGVRRANALDFQAAAESFADALEVAGDGWLRDVLQYRLGEMLARAGRPDAALEQLLPLVNRPQLDGLMNVIAEHLGVDQRAWNQRLDEVALARRCAELLVSVGSRARAAELFGRAFASSGGEDPRRIEIAELRFEVLVKLGESEAATELAATVAAESREQPERRVAWLLRIAAHGDERRKIEALTDAHALRPSDELAARLERALETFGEDERLEALLRARIEQTRIALASQHANASMRAQARERGAEALRKLIDLRRARPDGALDPSLLPLWTELLEFVPDDVDAMLELGAAHARDGRVEPATELWRRAGELLANEDDRFFVPALGLTRAALANAEFDEARALLDRALTTRPGDHDALELQRELAVASDDPELLVAAIEALIDQPQRSDERAQLELDAARARAQLATRRGTDAGPEPESLAAAVASFERAAGDVAPGSALHREITRSWLAVVATDSGELIGTDGVSEQQRYSPQQREALTIAREREARARAELRAAHGSELAPGDLRTEASLLALGLGRVDEGLSLVETALLADPDQPLLLSAFKDLCLATGAQARYADALDAAIAALSSDGHASETRDRLATELAFTAVELEDAPRLLTQLEHMSPERASSPELLDLREWAIRKLGRVEDELSEIDEELLASASDEDTAVLVERLLRMLDQDHDDTGRRLVMLAARAEPAVATRLRDATLELARSATPSYFDIPLGALEQLLAEHEPGQPPPAAVSEHWPAIEKLALERDDPGLLAMLLDLGHRAVELGATDLARRVEDLRDLSLTRHPESAELHALILGPLEAELARLEPEARLARADAAVNELAERLQPDARERALLWVGFAKLFDRREGAALLSRRARLELSHNTEFLVLLGALEENNHWTRALELLEYRVARDDDPNRQVADLKHLAHLCADILGDPDAAIGHLERALDHAPEDPDLMLPLLDHYYAQPQLDRAIELSSRVLEHVPMGAVAFAALGHRAADAALATGGHALAEKLLRKILTRAPDDARTRDRLRELEQLADDPEHRARMLAAIANRTAGSARVEALEERARLLIDPLGRLEEAIADLEAVTEEAPGRHAAVTTLADLYEQRQRWQPLVNLLEREYPRRQGLERVMTLERIALILGERLDEPSRAEKALRLALENLDSLGIDRLATQLDGHAQLRAELTVFTHAISPDRDLDDDLDDDDDGGDDGDDDDDGDDAQALIDRYMRPDAETRADDEPRAEMAPLDERVSLDQARHAWSRLADRLHLQIVACLEQQGRFSELIAHLEHELRAELEGDADPRERFPSAPLAANPRLTLIKRLARALRDHVDDGQRSAAVYVRLEQLDALPDDGLATLARWYRGQQRYDDLVRILTVRSRKLAQLGDWDRKSEADYRIGELLEGPLRRPHEAARFFLDAYLANPIDNPAAGARARVLLGGTDSVVNVRNRLLMRLPDLREDYKPALLTLLADLLSPHDDHEAEAERRYREALSIDAELAGSLEGLGRLLSRQGRLEDAIEPLTRAAQSPDIPDERAADDAAAAARALIELERGDEAEAVLKRALERAPESQRALLELARLYDRLDRKLDEAMVLERLAGLPLSSMLRAEVGYRQAMLLAGEFRDDPMSEAGEKARALLLEAVGADAMHAQARQTLLELASARSEWSIVAHMHFLAIRELPPGPRRALTHLDLAETYLDRLSDAQSSVRNLGAALQQAPSDLVVAKRASALAARLPEPGEVAARLEQFARATGRPELGEVFDDDGRARLLTVASELHLRNDTLEPAEAAARAATELPNLSEELRKLVERTLAQIVQIDQGEFDLRKRRKSLNVKLDACDDPIERLALFSRLRETARALEDRADFEETTRRQLELAHALVDGAAGPAKDAALEALRDVFAESGDYAKVVRLYEDLAGRTADASEAAGLLTSAARFAWSGLRDPRLAVAIVRRALDRAPTHAPATDLLGEIAGASDEHEVDVTICDELSQLAPRQRPPLLTLRLAEAALRLERREQAQAVLRQLLAGEASVELRLQALSLLDGLLDNAGRTHDRIPLLEERLELSRRHWPDRAADVALELARAQRAVGNLQDARATCRTALLDKASDQPLTKLYAELLEQAEDWPALARALEQLANLTIETREQAHWLTRAAQVHLDHGADGRESLAAARRLLERARAVSSESTEARAVLMPLAFHQGDWERVLELAIELRAMAGDEHEALIYAALTEAFARGKRTLARSIADRHPRPVRQRILWPVCARMLEIIATEGPLPRLDALLAAAAALCGGTEELLDELGAWAAGQPLQAGLALGLARLNEAFRRMELARHLYQIAAFMAPSGPVPVLTTRLPRTELPKSPTQEDSWVPLEWRGALREVLQQLREPLAGVRGQLGNSRPPRTPKERLAVRHADRIVNPWRTALGVDLAIAVAEQNVPAGIGLRNNSKPTIIVNEKLVDVPEAERTYRLAYAAAALATGVAIVFDDDPIGLPDILDALTSLVRPRHEPTTDVARGLIDTLAARGLTASKLDVDLRRALARELDHWRSAPSKLERVLHRACMLIAARLSGTIDGALSAMARDRGLLTEVGRPGDPAVLETPDAAWLLRALGIFGGQM